MFVFQCFMSVWWKSAKSVKFKLCSLCHGLTQPYHKEVEGSQFTNKYKDRVARHQCSDPAPGGRPCGVSRVLRKPDLYIVVTGSVVVQQFQISIVPWIITNVSMIMHNKISKICKYQHENVEISMCKYVNSNFQTI